MLLDEQFEPGPRLGSFDDVQFCATVRNVSFVESDELDVPLFTYA